MALLTETLLRARAAGLAADISARDLPEEVAQAYAVSCAQMQKVAGWKIGGANPWSQAVFNNEEVFVGPLHPRELICDTDQLSLTGLVAPLAEPEVMLEIGDLAADSWEARFPRMGLGFEVPASVLPDALKPQLTGQIVDRAGAGALWIGAIEPFDEQRLAQDFVATYLLNGIEVGTGKGSNVIDGPLGATAGFLRVAQRYELPLAPGQWVATGGLCPAVAVAPGDVLQLDAWEQSLRLQLI